MKEDKIQENIYKVNKILGSLRDKWDIGTQYYSKDKRRMKLLNSTDNGNLWQAINARFPGYQVLPDSNWVSRIKNNILASIYTVTKSAEIMPTGQNDRELCIRLSTILEHLWDTLRIGYKQFQAGERCALLNLGITQVSWSENIPSMDMFNSKGNVVLKNVDPMNYMRDPFSSNLEEAGWVCTRERYHKSVLLSNPKYKDSFKKYLASGGRSETAYNDYPEKPNPSASKDHVNVIFWWIRKPNGDIAEYHTIDNEYLLWENERVIPAVFPFAELYCNLPGSGLIGASEPAKSFANNMAYNLMNSIALTAEYKNQRPPKFVNSQSGLNLKAFSKHGDEADRTFVVQTDASNAVHYHQFPYVSPQMTNMMAQLSDDIKNSSGIDDRYTGRDTGSIITTGGTEEMLNRVTLIDTPKILCYEEYSRDLTKLILKNLIEFSPSRTYYIKKSAQEAGGDQLDYETIEIDFPHINGDAIFNYAIQISSELPKNKQRVQQWANTMMEKQMQYRQEGSNVELITEEEWLSYQDVPYKEPMFKRMGIQRGLDALEETAQVINEYADMLETGMDPNEAMVTAAQGLQNKREGMATPFEEQEAAAETAQQPLL